MVVDASAGLITSSVFPLVGGGAIGFAIGYLAKKLIKLAIIGLGLIFALIAFLAYRHWISVDWSTVEHQTSTTLQYVAQEMLNVVNKTAQDLNTHGNHIDIAYPVFGITGFLPGLALGLMKW